MSEKTNVEKLSVIVDFALRANPHVKFGIADVDEAWARLPSEQLRQIEGELTASGLFIVFGKKGGGRFMLKDSVRVDLIAAGSYDEYLLARKNTGEMSEKELELAGLRDKDDNILKADEDSRSRRKRSDKVIMAVGIAILIAALVIAKILLGRIR